MSLFEKREHILPFVYPQLLDYENAINTSFWLVDEFNYTSDIQNYHTDCTPHQKNVITRAMLAISQIEVTVKRFWGTLYDIFPIIEIALVGGAFDANEGRHFHTYRKLLELLGQNDLFLKINEFPALKARYDYMTKVVEKKNLSKQESAISTILFSMFVEHISLFSQFLIMMSFNKEKNMFKGISNAIEATSKEEELHGRFGLEVVNILKKEHPELFTDELYQRVKEVASEAIETELKIVDWIFDGQDLEFLSRETVINYIKKRYNDSFVNIGLEPVYEINNDLYKQVQWFDIEVIALKENDQFNKRSTDYSKKQKAITEDDLF